MIFTGKLLSPVLFFFHSKSARRTNDQHHQWTVKISRVNSRKHSAISFFSFHVFIYLYCGTGRNHLCVFQMQSTFARSSLTFCIDWILCVLCQRKIVSIHFLNGCINVGSGGERSPAEDEKPKFNRPHIGVGPLFTCVEQTTQIAHIDRVADIVVLEPNEQ